MTNTDWALVRAMMGAAIDACEQIESLGYTEADRDITVDAAGRTVSVFDIMTSAWTYPETIGYQIIRERHDKGADQPYVPETARIVVNMARACAELVGSGEAAPAQEPIRKMLRWYENHAGALLGEAIASRRD